MTTAPDLDALIVELHDDAKWYRRSQPTVSDLFTRAADALSTAKAQGAEEMRERCAKVAEDLRPIGRDYPASWWEIAAAIRALPATPEATS